MAISDKQKELDKIKWEKSQLLGIDACGTFDYCSKCNKNRENPCEVALDLFLNPDKVINDEVKTEKTTKATAKKSCTKKSTSEKKSTSSTKKTTAKKTTKK